MRFPDGYLWEYPGFPAIAISYLKTNDFFYSGHVGLPMILALEFKKLGCFMCLFWISIFTMLLEAFTMIVTRGHYCIDLITGIIVAHYIYMLVDEFCKCIDNSCLSMCLTNRHHQSSSSVNKPDEERRPLNNDLYYNR
jgi:hypothetical protein